MRGSQLTSSLHVPLQVPKLPEANVGNIDNVCAQCNGGSDVVSIGTLGGERLYKSREVFVQGKQPKQLRWGLAVRFRVAVGRVYCLLVLGDGVGVEMSHFVHVDWNTSAISSAGKSWVLDVVVSKGASHSFMSHQGDSYKLL